MNVLSMSWLKFVYVAALTYGHKPWVVTLASERTSHCRRPVWPTAPSRCYIVEPNGTRCLLAIIVRCRNLLQLQLLGAQVAHCPSK